MSKGIAFYNATLGISGLVVGCFCITAAVAMLAMPRQKIDLQQLEIGKVENCKQEAKKHGLVSNLAGSRLTLTETGLDDYKSKLFVSSLVLAQCEGFSLNSFCMGECGDDKGGLFTGMRMELTYLPPTVK